ncbi:MAG TPA: hypothetical protein VNJ07_06135 [Chitinophagales bacterium]|nr:hypothetical protein [Chitinophagales bacterium]
MDIYVDVDNTVCHTEGTDYQNAKPNYQNIARINRLYDEGNRIVYWTARGMKTGINWRELTERQFKDWGIKYHELRLDKPPFDVFIDDRVINTRDWEKGRWINS